MEIFYWTFLVAVEFHSPILAVRILFISFQSVYKLWIIIPIIKSLDNENVSKIYNKLNIFQIDSLYNGNTFVFYGTSCLFLTVPRETLNIPANFWFDVPTESFALSQIRLTRFCVSNFWCPFFRKFMRHVNILQLFSKWTFLKYFDYEKCLQFPAWAFVQSRCKLFFELQVCTVRGKLFDFYD